MGIEMTPGGIFKAFRDPLGTAWDMAKGAADPEKLISAPGVIEKVTGIAGRSIIVDPTQEATERLKNPKGPKRDFFGTIFHFFKKRVATWGILAGILAWLASIGIGKYQSSSENPNPLLGTVSMVAKALIFAAPAASVWGQITKNVEKVANIDPSIFLRSKGNEIIEKFQLIKKVEENTLKEDKNKTMLLNHSEKSTETTIIQNISKDKPVKSIIIGPENSGQGTLANKISAQIAEVEASASTDKREVVVEVLDCVDALVKLRQQASQNPGWKDLVSGLTSQLPRIGSLSSDQLADSVIYGIEQRIDEAKNQGNKRLVVQLKNIDVLWRLAAKKDGVDLDLISKIEAALCDLLNKDNKYDVVITSNVPNDKTLGLLAMCGSEFLKQHKVGENLPMCVEALESDSLSISALDDTTKIQAIASAIVQKLNISDERVIRGQISKAIEYRLRGRHNEIVKEFDAAVINSKKTRQALYTEDYVEKIRDYYTAAERFKKLGSGDIYSLMAKITVPDNVKNNLLNGKDDEKEKAALYIIDELINKSENITSSEKGKIEENVKENKSSLETRKKNTEDGEDAREKIYRDNISVINIIKKICEKSDEQIVAILDGYEKSNKNLRDRIDTVLANCHEDDVQAFVKRIHEAYGNTL